MPQTDYEIMVDAAYQRGYSACGRGARCSENPFHPGSQADEYDAWKDGWKDRDNWESSQETTYDGPDRDEWRHEAAAAMRLKR